MAPHLVFIVSIALGFAPHEISLTDSLKCDLLQSGFENVSVVLEDGNMVVAYENRVFRHEIRAIRQVMAILFPIVGQNIDVTLIPQNRGIPLVAITMTANEYLRLSNWEISDEEFAFAVDISLDVDQIWRKMRKYQKENVSFHKFDIVIHPQFKALFGDFDNRTKAQINLAPKMNTALWRGMLLSAQLIIPLYNELDEEEDHWRPGLLTINQTFRVPYNSFISATVGYFTRDRYGTDLEIRRYFADGKWAIGANIGYTGYASYLEGTWRYSDIDYLTAFFDVECRVSQFNLTLSAMYGRYLFRDKGWRFSILRQFGEVDIGFFALKTERGGNAGFSVCIPIFPSRYSPARRIRLRPAEELSLEYRYKRLPESSVQYETGNGIDQFMKELD